MQSHRGITKRSPSKIVLPFDNLTRKNDRQRPLGSPSEPAESPVASNQKSAPESESMHFGFCSLGEPINERRIFESIGVVSVMTTEESRSSPSITERKCNCASIRQYASMIRRPNRRRNCDHLSCLSGRVGQCRRDCSGNGPEIRSPTPQTLNLMSLRLPLHARTPLRSSRRA